MVRFCGGRNGMCEGKITKRGKSSIVCDLGNWSFSSVISETVRNLSMLI